MTEAQLSAAEVAEDLPRALWIPLGVAFGQDDIRAEEIIRELRFESRRTLIDYGVIFAFSTPGHPDEELVEFGLTELGREVMFECAQRLTDEDRDLVQESIDSVKEDGVRLHEQASDEAFHRLHRA